MRYAVCSLRIYPESKSDIVPIEADVAWLGALAGGGIHVPQPVRDRNGSAIRRWQSARGAPPRHAVFLSWLRGQMFDRGLMPARLRGVGSMTAHLHRVARPLTQSGAIATPRLAYATGIAQWAREPNLSPYLRGAFPDAALTVLAMMSASLLQALAEG
jgi:Ser/Thr protein kinase RdoA (MazF antagonist)